MCCAQITRPPLLSCPPTIHDKFIFECVRLHPPVVFIQHYDGYYRLPSEELRAMVEGHPSKQDWEKYVNVDMVLV